MNPDDCKSYRLTVSNAGEPVDTMAPVWSVTLDIADDHESEQVRLDGLTFDQQAKILTLLGRTFLLGANGARPI